MVEKLQCPVCTLFLHAGMNLSDHLETHPKEQVIMALVQLTIPRTECNETADNEERTLADEKKRDVESSTLTASSKVEKEPEVGTSNESSSPLNLPFGTQQPKKEPDSAAPPLPPSGKQVFKNQDVSSSPTYQKNIGAINLVAGVSGNVAVGQNEVSQMPTDFSTFPNRYQITQQHQQQPQQNVPGTTQRTSPNPPLELTHQIGQHTPSGLSNVFHSKFHHQQRQQLQMLTPLHAQHQSAHRLPHPLPLTQQQSKLNVIFSSALPPPPPQVQLFNYQSSTQPLHQKPPPAYGTAISQMRSQHNQNKQTHHQQHMQRTGAVQTASSSKQFLERKSVTPLLQATSPQKQHHSQQKNETVHLYQQFTKNILSNVVSTSLQKSVAYQQGSVQPPSPPSIDEGVAVAPPLHSRLTHSPYPSILSAAVASSSPCSSVLRYAESPVTAHYLERDNGDFIVQETPKRIVECVEKDNGEFSVIERFYQSPPSVLRIHDDEEDNEVLDVSEQDKPIVNEKSIKAQTRKEDNTEDIDQDTEEEFMSIDGDSDVEESSSEKSLPEVRGRNIKESVDQDVCVEKPTTSAAAAAQVEQSENTALPIVGNNNTVASNGVTNIARKKSSKNTITVLSDVQLNLNEYLDLVGNIIASSKIAKSQAFAAATPVPLLKVEKVEPMDEYETEDQQQPQSPVGVEDKITNSHVSDAEIKEPALASCLREPPTKTTTNNKENITETDELVANIYSDKPTTPEKSSTHRAGVDSNLTKQPTSHATTSVIRMATTTTSQQHLQQQLAEQPQNTSEDCTDELEVGKTSDRLKHVVLNSSVAEDLSPQTQIKSEVVSTETTSVPSLQPPLKKGPKKLVIKPKLSTTEAKNRRDSQPLCEEQPTTYARAKKLEAEQDMLKHSLAPKNVVIKSEPNITIEATSILEQHLHLSAHPFELKQAKFLCRQDTSAEFKHESLKFNIKHEVDELNNTPKVSAEDRPTNSTPLHVDEETRVLMEFASSNKKEVIEISSSSANTTFLSANSIFGVASTEEILINSTSNSTSSLARATSVASCNALATLRCDDEFIVPDATDCVQEIIISSCYSSQSASDVALNNCSNVTDIPNSHQQQHNNFSDYPFSFLYGGGSVAQEVSAKSNFSPIYQQQQHDATTAATLASGSNSATIEELSSDQAHRNQTTNRYHHHDVAPARQWYQSVSTSNTDFETALDVDCGGVEDGDAGNYLDLDSYKRVNMTGGVQTGVGPSSSLSSFTAATESSLAGCTTDALNIRTDEKMPAKGEISEQESNCDIENSWSQSMYGDIPVRFFKSSFPGLFPPENCWNNEEYFTVQDLSASTGATNASNRATKSFDFRLPLEAGGTSSSSATPGCSSVHQRIDSLPSTSSKRKRKRDSNTKNSVTTRPIAATVTSHDLLLQDSEPQQSLPQQQDHQLDVYHEEPPTTSAAILAGPSTAAAASSTSTLQNRVGKVFSCVHCLAKFSRLKDRNLHMIAQHNYVLRNYRLVPMQKVVTSTATMAKTTFVPATIADLDVTSAGASCSSNKLSARHQNLEQQEDSKQGIVKIELDPAEQAISGRLSADVEGVGHILAKSELDESAGLALANNVVAAVSESADPVFLPSLTRLYNLYHMLVSFNIAALKQNQTLSEADEKLMLSSIFFCFICRQKFGTVKLYDAHMTEHPAECYTCGKKFHRWQNLSLHLKRHLGWKEFGCSICDKKFVVRSALVEHMRMHTGQKPLKCNICDKHFKRFSNLAQHRKRHGKQIIRKKEFVCHCGEVLPSKARFLWHKETHDAKPKCCPYCCDRFVHANSLRRHIRLAHSDKFDYTEPMECPMCKQVFAKSSIRAHMATHSMDMQHMCPICSKSFSTKWNLKIHSWVHANRTSKPFKCEHCPKAFVREVDFKNHMNAHKQIKPYTCEYCGCKFIRKYNYMRHRREHHGNKKFTCDLCKKSFHRHYYLIEHRRIHTGERPFQCTICGKSSTTKTNHNKHLKIHHSRDPFTVEA